MTSSVRLWWMVFAGLTSFALCAGGPSLRTTSAEDKKVELKVSADRMPRIPATELNKALSTFKVARGFRLELVAAEPDVSDPVDACFDENGRMFVAEMHGYPYSQEPTKYFSSGGGKKDAGIIRLLEDTDGDGKMDRSVVFADKISWPTSVCCYNGGVFVLAPEHIYYFKDTDGDDVADVREVVYSGFGRGNVQGLANNLKWGLDNHIYAAGGRNGAGLTHRGKKLFSLGNRDIRFNPRTEELEAVSGGLQFGHSMDDWGNRFVCSNSNHMLHVVYPGQYLKRNPYFAVSGIVRSIAKEGGSGPVFRTSPPEPWRIVRQEWRAAKAGYKLVQNKDGSWGFEPLDPSKKKGVVPTEYPVGYFTSATGVTIYRGGAYPQEFHGNAFVGDVGGNLVHRKLVRPKGAGFVAIRADAGEEFITSSDNWFRPVNYVNAPDGTLYVLDMYRETIEHPYSVPIEIKKYLDLESGSDRGRIYRIVSPGMKRIRPPKLGSASIGELVAELASDNVWNRETAQRLLWERQDQSAAAPLVKLFKTSQSSLGRLHALYALDGLDALTPEVIARGLGDPHPGVREHSIRLSEKHLDASPELAAALLNLSNDPADRVRFQLAFSLGELHTETAVTGLVRLARGSGNGGDIRNALLTSVAETADRIALRLLDDPDFIKQRGASGLLSELARIVGANKNLGPSLRLLARATSSDSQSAIQKLILQGLGEGLSRRGSTIPKLLRTKSADVSLRSQVNRLFESAAAAVADDHQSESQRLAAIDLLAFADYKTAEAHLSGLLSPQMPQSLQRAAVAALSKQDDNQVGKLLIDGWRSHSPNVRRDVVDALLRSVGRIDTLLAAVESKAILSGEIDRNKKQLLTNHPTVTIRDRSRKLFAGEITRNRAKVVAAYQKALDLSGDPQRGFEVFKQKCSVCHRVGTVGHQVAPELTSIQNKSPGDLVVAILDPNREAQPNFTTYTVVTEQGKIYNGIIVVETATSLTLRRAEAKEDVVLRSNIETLISSGKSLMPEGLEKDVSLQQMADVIAFIKTIKPAKK